MAIYDSNPERKNLTVTSLSFIIFFLAGGKVSSDIIRLQVINVEFSRPDVLVIIVWGGLFWFWYRFWLTNKTSFWVEFKTDFSLMNSKKFLHRYLNDTLGKNEIDSNAEYYPIGLEWENGKVVLEYTLTTDLRRNRDGSYSGSNSVGDGGFSKLGVGGRLGWFIVARLVLCALIQRPSFSSYMVPHILAFLAFCLGVNNVLIR